MRKLSLPFLHHFREAGPFVARGIAGVIFLYHGWQKFQQGISNVAGFFDSLGVPLPEVSAWGVAILELVGGAFLIVGLLSRIVALLFVFLMIGSTLFAKIDVGLIAPQGGGAGAELDLALLACAAVVLFAGPGALALDHALKIEPRAIPAGRPGTRRVTAA